MIITEHEYNYEDIQKQREEFDKYKNTLRKEPEGENVKKRYSILCETQEDWDYIHEVLTQDGTLEDNIPQESIECVDPKLHSLTRGTYLLTDKEVEELLKHPKIKNISIDRDYYEGTYKINPRDLMCSIPKTVRYTSNRKQYRAISGSGISTSPNSSDISRSGYQIKRCMQKYDPWLVSGGSDMNSASNKVLYDSLAYYGDGSDVDVIVGDTVGWFGHPEFNYTGNQPNYIRGNVLSGIATCGILDLVLDSPYYIDPDYFNASPGSRLTTRWDGTVVPVESAARNWWGNDSTLYRSSKFVSPSNGGTAVGSDAFGSISVISGYTRSTCNGSNAARPLGDSHGTSCMALCYGKTQGWAFNSNKWYVNVYDSNSLGAENWFDMMKIFHQIKPINSKYGTRNPTISSNSWGYRDTEYRTSGTKYAFFRGGVGVAYTTGTIPQFLKWNGYWGDTSRLQQELVSSSMTVAADECVNSGVIVVVASGNANQKIVKYDHPDYDNYWSTSSTGTILNSTHSLGTVYNTTNRPGFPQHAGKDIASGITYKTISIGALSAVYRSDASPDLNKESKVNYSNTGNAVDCYLPAHDALAATTINTGIPHPETYVGFSTNAFDRGFSGTSAACPVAAGLIATKLQYNRSWSWSDVRNWISGLEEQIQNQFYYGEEPNTINDSRWFKETSVGICGGKAIVMYDLPTGNETSQVSDTTGEIKFASGSGLDIRGNGLIIK